MIFYFVPRIGGTSLVSECGFAYAFDGGKPRNTCEVGPEIGPDGLTGMVFHNASLAGNLPRGLEWFKAANGLYWIGHHPQAKPTPHDFRRSEIDNLGGADVKLADGQLWRIPLVLPCVERDANRATGLPSEPRREPDGQRKVTAKREYDALQFMAFRFLETMDESNAPKVDAFPFCEALLAVGYRVTEEEILALRLFDERVCSAMVWVALDGAERAVCMYAAARGCAFDAAEAELTAMCEA